MGGDPKTIHQIAFVKQSKNIDGETAYDTQSMFVLTVLEKIKKTGL